MALEADLGVDSIKRVQIVGALRDRFPGAPVAPERVAELQTLSDLAGFLAPDTAGASAAGAGGVGPAGGAQSGPVVGAGAGPAGNTNGSVAGGVSVRPAAPGTSPAVARPPVIERLRAKPRPIPAVDPLEDPFGPGATALVIEMGAAGGARVARECAESGMSVETVTIDVSAGSAGWDGDGVEAAVAARLKGRLDLCVLVVGTPGGTVAAGPGWDAAGLDGVDEAGRALGDAILAAKSVVGALRAAARLGRRSVFVAVARLDGQLGYRGAPSLAAAVTGGLTGLVKTLAREVPEVACRAVDVHPALDDDAYAAAVLAEARDGARDVSEVGVEASGRRWSVDYAATDDPAGSFQSGRPPVDRDDVLVVTGGARGVTASCVLALARRVSCEFVLLGRTELAEDPAWAVGFADGELRSAYLADAAAAGRKARPAQAAAAAAAVTGARQVRATLAELAATGAKAHYVSVDASDPVAARLALAPWRDRVTGVVHGAGALTDAMLVDKSAAAVSSVLSPKLDGLRGVLAALDGSPLRHLVLFGSVAGVFGNPGQADYAAANEALTRVAVWARGHLDGRVVTINWGAWDGGMVTAELREMFLARGVGLLAPEEGARRFVAELVDGPGADGAVLVGGAAPLTAAAPPQPIAFTAARRLAAMHDEAVLDQHRIGASPVLPATAGLGWMINGVERALPGLSVVEVLDFAVHKGIVFDGDDPGESWLEARPILSPDGGAPAGATAPGVTAIAAAVRSPGAGLLPTSRYSAVLRLADHSVPAPLAPNWPQGGYRLGEQGEDAAWLYTDGLLMHGPRMRGVRRLLVREPSRVVLECRQAELSFADGAFAGHLHRPVLCDVLAAAATLLARWNLDDLGVLPLGIGRMELFAPLPDDEPFVVVVDDVKADAMQATVTVTACAPDGRVYHRLTDVSLVGTADMADLIRQGAARHQPSAASA
jgi:hypothetical protein